MTSIAQKIVTNWHPMRWLVLAIGLFLAIQAFTSGDGLLGVLGAFFLFQALTNSGCMLSASCGFPAADRVKAESSEIKNVEFTEIKEE